MRILTHTQRLTRLLVLVLCIGFTKTGAIAQIATWDLIGINTAGNVTSAAATTNDPGITVSALVKNSGMGSSNGSFANSINGTHVYETTLAASIAGNAYIEFTITPVSGKTVSITSIDVCAITQGKDGTVSLLSSIGGFTADKEISNIITGSGNEINVSTQNLAVSGHNNLTSAVTFRFYFYGASNWDWNAFGIGERHPVNTTASLIVNGTVTAPDASAPITPGNLAASNVGEQSLTLSWTASTDDIGVTGYDIYNGAILIGSTTTELLYNVTGLTAQTAYIFYVKAKDASGKFSSPASLDVSTSDSDNTPPSAPTALSSTNITFSGFTLSWTESTDNVGVVSYEVFRGTTSCGTATGTTLAVSGLNESTTYSMTVIAKDAAGNTSIASEPLDVTTIAYVPGALGFLEDFNDNTLTNWYSGSYGLTEANQMLKINPVKSDVWAGFGFSFPQIDITTVPYVSMKIKSNIDFNISVAVGTKDGKIDNYPLKFNTILVVGAQEVVASDEFQEYSFDYTGIPAEALQTASNLHFVLNPLTQEFGSAPNKEIYFDDIKIGDVAVRTPAIATIQDQLFTVQASGTVARTVKFRNVTDGSTGTNAINITATSSNPACIPDPAVIYTSADKTGSLVLDPNLLAVGEAVISVVVSAPTTTNKIMTFKVKVMPNAAPTMTAIPDLITKKGTTVKVKLDNINDGNSEAMQNISVTGKSSDIAIIPAISIQRDPTDFAGLLSFTTASDTPPGSTATVSVTLKDNGGTASGGVDSTVYTFLVTVYDEINNPPTLDVIPTRSVKAFAGNNSFDLTGISDGDNKSQSLTFEVSATDNNIVSNLSVGTVVKGVAPLNFTLSGNTGTASITVKVTDNGGASGNNGNQSVIRTFVMTAVESPVTGLVANYVPFVGNVAASGITTATDGGVVDILADGTVHITGTVMPQTFPANMFSLAELTGGKELDMSANKLVSFKFKGASTMMILAPGTPKKLDKTLIYFRVIDDQQPGSATSGYNISYFKLEIANDDAWHDIYLDFNGKFYKDADGKQTDSTRINRLMLDINSQWFPKISVDCYFKDIKLGDKAEKPLPTPQATLNDIPNQTFYTDEAPKPVLLSGISDGSGNATADLTVSADNESLVSSLSIVPNDNGTALLSYTLKAGVADSARITVIAKNTTVATSIPDTASFTVYTVDKALMANNTVVINLAKTYQTMAGVGCFMNNNDNPDQIQQIKDLNITVLRLTSSGELEPENENSDPNVTDFSNLNHSAIPTDVIRNINENTDCHKFFYTIWTAPSWMKQNKADFPSSATQWAANNKLKPEMYEEFAEYVVAICKIVKEEAGVELYAISLQNEPTFNEPYVSCQYTGAEFRELVKVVGPKMQAENLSTRIMLSEDVNANNWVQANVAATNDDAATKNYLGIIACHLYDPDGIRPGGAGAANWTSLLTFKKTTLAEGLWMTETSGFSNIWEGYWGKDYLSGNPQFFPGPLDFAGSMYTSFKYGNISGWADLNSTSEKTNDDLLGSVFKNFSAFVNPGSVMVDAISSSSNILSLAFKNTDNTVTAILLNTSKIPMKVTLQGQNVPSLNRTFTTQNFSPFAKGPAVTDGYILLPPRSITTLTHSEVNAPPVYDQLESQEIALPDGDKNVTINGIGYGQDINPQSVTTVIATSSNPAIANVLVIYSPNAATAELKITPVALGTSIITVTIKDDGGTANGGVDSTQLTFTVHVVLSGVGLKDLNKAAISLYPNPAHNNVFVKLGNETAESIVIRDISGRIVQQEDGIRGKNNLELSIGTLPKGLYFITVKTKEQSHTLKFVRR